MTRPLTAALLSGVVFPGLGHLILKYYRRGLALLFCALAATVAVITVVTQKALTIIDEIGSRGMPIETDTITELVSDSTTNMDNSIGSIALLILLACWLFGIIDSYRLGKMPPR